MSLSITNKEHQELELKYRALLIVLRSIKQQKKLSGSRKAPIWSKTKRVSYTTLVQVLWHYNEYANGVAKICMNLNCKFSWLVPLSNLDFILWYIPYAVLRMQFGDLICHMNPIMWAQTNYLNLMLVQSLPPPLRPLHNSNLFSILTVKCYLKTLQQEHKIWLYVTLWQ